MRWAGLIAALVATAVWAGPRDQISIVGSSTMFPYSQSVAEVFASLPGHAPPIVEATGTGGGMKRFCEGVGPETPDITAASRAMTGSERADCERNGVDAIGELRIGHDGVSLATARAGPTMALTRALIFQALAAEVEIDGVLVANPFRTWRDIDPALPDVAIKVFGPPPTSGTRDMFVELVMDKGCEAFPAIARLDPSRKAQVCSGLRWDGAYVDAGEDDNTIVGRLEREPTAVGILGYLPLRENSDGLRPIAIDGVPPTEETIRTEEYPLARSLYIYVKEAHRAITPGLRDFVAEYVSENGLGPDGYLAEHGLIALSPERREKVRALAAGL